MYANVVAEMDVDDVPRDSDSHVVRNKKYNDTAKSRSKGHSATVIFAHSSRTTACAVGHAR